MSLDFTKQELHDPADPEVQQLLEAIQGNILKGHGRDNTVHIFVKFNLSEVKVLQENLIKFAAENITSALDQHIESEQFKKFKIPGAIFGNIFLTARGYQALGFSAEQLQAVFSDDFFLKGMAEHREDFNDPPLEQWDEGFSTSLIDAMFLLADDDKNFLLRQSRLLINDLNKFCEIITIEQGAVLRDDVTQEGIEHFGYVDGRSQPIYLTTDLKNEGKIDKWNPVEPLNVVLIEDKTISGKKSFGSYFVFRKLEQNVLGFKTLEITLADELGLSGQNEKERAGAMVVGRFEDGTPVTRSQTDGFMPIKENNFTYEDDKDGLKCPFQAHIRKSNPRGDTTRKFGKSERDERNHRITRRGIPYGERSKNPHEAQTLTDFPTKDVGLLFMCFQASIANQFSFIQQSWVNNEGFVQGGVGIDPVIGQAKSEGPVNPQKWRAQWNEATSEENPEQKFSFSGFVTMKGGEFFFAPGMEFLKRFAPI